MSSTQVQEQDATQVQDDVQLNTEESATKRIKTSEGHPPTAVTVTGSRSADPKTPNFDFTALFKAICDGLNCVGNRVKVNGEITIDDGRVHTFSNTYVFVNGHRVTREGNQSDLTETRIDYEVEDKEPKAPKDPKEHPEEEEDEEEDEEDDDGEGQDAEDYMTIIFRRPKDEGANKKKKKKNGKKDANDGNVFALTLDNKEFFLSEYDQMLCDDMGDGDDSMTGDVTSFTVTIERLDDLANAVVIKD